MKKIFTILVLLFACISFNARAQKQLAEKVVVYYFHTTARCVSCHKIEQYTKETLESSFSDAMTSGKIDFQMLNTEDPENRHFVQDYQLYTKSVVLSKVKDGKEIEFKNLDKIWNLLGNKEKFSEYIKLETQDFLEKDKEM